eukprot:TRINITY_DN22394_c0_g1_i1.p1 TRINITY_DN22394_c0_g1~~TRINITY_DN22394_c0_g1_i1.p1  ORF type:complete len:204 (+),score=25.17 TRINITY_DN22394_c0_g1_i1:158-769(+)
MTAVSLSDVIALSDVEQVRTAKRNALYRKHFDYEMSSRRTIIKSILWSDAVMTARVVPFSWPGEDDIWEEVFGSGPLSPHWPLIPNKVEVEKNGVSERFGSVNAAYQALKYWTHDDIRSSFRDAYTPEEVTAVRLKYRSVPIDADFQKYPSMLTALRACYFSIKSAADMLLSTSGCFLLCCHPSPIAVTDFWSDGNAIGENKL